MGPRNEEGGGEEDGRRGGEGRGKPTSLEGCDGGDQKSDA